MNAVIALCHFCELHGPSVLFCTQAFHEHFPVIRSNTAKPGVSDDDKTEPVAQGKKAYYGPASLMISMQTGNASNSGSSMEILSENCEGCCSMLPKLKRFICNDHEAKVSYISSQYPMHPELFSLVRQACVRSLSCEVCPGREGPIYFGDNERGHVLSYTFFMKDSHARGFQRWYSVIMVMIDKMFLLNSWLFLTKNIQKLVSELQSLASKVYDAEQSEISQRTLRLNSVTSMTPDNFRRQRGNAKARSLTELTGDTSVFPRIHLWFTWILRAGGCRISERLLEGRPSEDAVVNMELYEEKGEGSKKVDQTSLDDCLDEIKEPKFSPVSAQLSETVESKESETVANYSTVSSLQELYSVIGKEMFLVLSYHTIIGNQIILRGSPRKLIKSIIDILQTILPRGCCQPLYYSNQYEDSWKCNFLGISSDVTVPKHVQSSPLHLLVDVTESISKHGISPWKLTLQHCVTLPEKLPQVLNDIERMARDAKLKQNSFEACLTTLKEVWMNKAKVLFAFSRAGHHPVEDTQKLLNVLGAQEHDKMFLKFWMTGLSTQYKMHILSSSVQHNPESPT